MRNVLRIFLGADGTKPALVLLGLLVAGVLDAVSISAMLPAASQVAGGVNENSSEFNRTVIEILNSIGIKPDLTTLILIVATALVLKNAISFLAMTYAGYSVAVVSARMRRRVFRALLKTKWAYFADLRGGHIASTLSQNISTGASAYIKSAQCVSYAIQGAAFIAVALLISPYIALAACVFGIVLFAGMSGLVRLGRKAGYRQIDSTMGLVTQINDLLGNIKPIKTMNRQENLTGYFEKQVRRLKRAMVKQAVARYGIYYGRDAIAVVVIGIGVYVAVVHGKMPLPELIVLALIFLQLLSVFSKIQSQYQAFSQFEGGYWRTMEQTESLESNPEVDTGTVKPELLVGCSFDHVNFHHGEKQILHDTSLEIAAGGITVLQGPSGAGKTTIIDLLIGLHQPTSGKIAIDGTDIADISLAAWRDMIGYVPQELSLLHGTIRDNITLGDVSITDEAIVDALELAGAEEFVDSLADGLDTSVGEMGARLSGGQRQRISLARALAGGPKMLILDEVTSALDPETEKMIVDGIASLAGNFTIVAITHRPAWAEIATSVYDVHDGRVTQLKKSGEKGKTHAA